LIDFEVGLQKAIKNNFPNALISGFFFHFFKCLWKMAKNYIYVKKKKLNIQKY
jgi:hypothetical protein